MPKTSSNRADLAKITRKIHGLPRPPRLPRALPPPPLFRTSAVRGLKLQRRRWESAICAIHGLRAGAQVWRLSPCARTTPNPTPEQNAKRGEATLSRSRGRSPQWCRNNAGRRPKRCRDTVGPMATHCAHINLVERVPRQWQGHIGRCPPPRPPTLERRCRCACETGGREHHADPCDEGQAARWRRSRKA